jgi:hypothetical protein
LYAQNNWWGTDGAQILVDGTSLLDASNPLVYDPWNQGPPPNEEDGMKIISVINPEDGGGNSDSSILAGLSLEREERIVEAILHYKRMVTDNMVPGFALGRLVGIKHRYNIQNLREYLESLLGGNRPYRPIALTLFAGILMSEDKYEQAMFLYNKIVSDYPGSYHSVNALFAKFFAALNYENDRVLAGEILQELEALNLEDEEYLMRLAIAQNLYNEGGNEYLGKSVSADQTDIGSEIPKEYVLSENYPNPFNPSTTIKYQIPKDGFVTLKVYDILGAEVANLVNEDKVAGRYEVSFDASLLASGVYIYRLNVNDYVNVKKMVLMK